MSKFGDFIDKYNEDQIKLADTLARIDMKTEGLDTFKKATIEHAIKIKNAEIAIAASHKRIKGLSNRMWVTLTSIVLMVVAVMTKRLW